MTVLAQILQYYLTKISSMKLMLCFVNMCFNK